jgi:hypothetical protein
MRRDNYVPLCVILIGDECLNGTLINIYIYIYIVTWTVDHSVNTHPPAVFLHAVPSRAEVSRAELKHACC